MIKNYTWDICGQEDYRMVQQEIEVLRDTYKNVKVMEVHSKNEIMAIMVEVY